MALPLPLASAIKLLQYVGPVAAALPEFKEIFNDIVAAVNGKDQAVLLDAYEDLIEDNNEGHARLQEKLAAASRQ